MRKTCIRGRIREVFLRPAAAAVVYKDGAMAGCEGCDGCHRLIVAICTAPALPTIQVIYYIHMYVCICILCEMKT